MTVVYIDSLFFLNLLLNYLLLLVTAKLAGEPLRRWRLAGSAALGALYAVAVFLPGLAFLSLPLCRVAAGILLALVAFGHSPRLLRVTLLFFGISAAFAGVMLALQFLGGRALTIRSGVLYSPLDLRGILLAAALCYCVLSLVFRRAAIHTRRDLLPATLTFHGKSTRLTALVDTGNTLCDPLHGGPVMVAEGARLAELLPALPDLTDPISAMGALPDPRRFRLLPYRAVGVECGMLLALRVDNAVVGGREYGSILVALSPTPVSDGGGYQALIGAQ